MLTRERFNEVALKLASIDPDVRNTAFEQLKSLASHVQSEHLTRLSVGLFYFHYYSDSPYEEEQSRARILGFLNDVSPELQPAFRHTFLESLVKLWESVDNDRVARFLRLLKSFYSKIYAEFQAEATYKRAMVAWNDFLSTCIIFNTRCDLTSRCRRPRAPLYAAND
jgi:hypothetical protein